MKAAAIAPRLIRRMIRFIFPPYRLPGRLSAKGDANARRQQQVICLCARQRIAQVTVAERELPAESFVDAGEGRCVKVHAVLSRVREIGKEDQFLSEQS